MTVYTVDTDGVSGDYSSIATLSADIGIGIPSDLTGTGGHTFECYASTGKIDQVTEAGATFELNTQFSNYNASNTIKITVAQGHRCKGFLFKGYTIKFTSSSWGYAGFIIPCNYCIIEHLGWTWDAGVSPDNIRFFNSNSDGSNVTIRYNVIADPIMYLTTVNYTMLNIEGSGSRNYSIYCNIFIRADTSTQTVVTVYIRDFAPADSYSAKIMNNVFIGGGYGVAGDGSVGANSILVVNNYFRNVRYETYNLGIDVATMTDRNSSEGYWANWTTYDGIKADNDTVFIEPFAYDYRVNASNFTWTNFSKSFDYDCSTYFTEDSLGNTFPIPYNLGPYAYVAENQPTIYTIRVGAGEAYTDLQVALDFYDGDISKDTGSNSAYIFELTDSSYVLDLQLRNTWVTDRLNNNTVTIRAAQDNEYDPVSDTGCKIYWNARYGIDVYTSGFTFEKVRIGTLSQDTPIFFPVGYYDLELDRCAVHCLSTLEPAFAYLFPTRELVISRYCVYKFAAANVVNLQYGMLFNCTVISASNTNGQLVKDTLAYNTIAYNIAITTPTYGNFDNCMGNYNGSNDTQNSANTAFTSKPTTEYSIVGYVSMTAASFIDVVNGDYNIDFSVSNAVGDPKVRFYDDFGINQMPAPKNPVDGCGHIGAYQRNKAFPFPKGFNGGMTNLSGRVL